MLLATIPFGINIAYSILSGLDCAIYYSMCSGEKRAFVVLGKLRPGIYTRVGQNLKMNFWRCEEISNEDKFTEHDSNQRLRTV